MKKSLVISLLTAAFLAASFTLALTSASAANGPGRVEHHVQFMTKLLSLTPAQQQQATTIFTNAATGAKTIHASLKTEHQNLKQAIIANNAAAIDQESATIGTLMTQMTSNRAKAQAAFYQILTPDQQAKLTAFQNSHHRHGHRHHPNGTSDS